MNKRHLRLPTNLVLLLLLLSACAPKSTLQQPAQNFYNAASDLAAAEPKVLNDINATQLSLDEISQKIKYIDRQNFGIPNSNHLISDARIKLRSDLTQAISLYAQTLLSLTNIEISKDINGYSIALAQDLQKGIPDYWKGLPEQDTQIVGSALSSILQIVIDQKVSSSIISEAQKAQPALEKIQKLFNSDIEYLSKMAQGMLTLNKTAHAQLLDKIRQDPRVTRDKLYEIWTTVRNSNTPTITLENLKNITKLCDSLVKANSALATNDTISFTVFTQEAYKRGVDAYNTYQQLKK